MLIKVKYPLIAIATLFIMFSSYFIAYAVAAHDSPKSHFKPEDPSKQVQFLDADDTKCALDENITTDTIQTILPIVLNYKTLKTYYHFEKQQRYQIYLYLNDCTKNIDGFSIEEHSISVKGRGALKKINATNYILISAISLNKDKTITLQFTYPIENISATATLTLSPKGNWEVTKLEIS
ncbi:MAG: hypothetical protein HQL25_01850 [Candidatus Omnitrophica bacterium]|nr:hypothetical protein [Candidatus Omnitrophota bacterium]